MSSIAQLQCYQVARQLNLLPALHEAAAHSSSDDESDEAQPAAGTLLAWLSRDALPRDAQHALHTAQDMLQHWLSAHVASGADSESATRDVAEVSEHILSFVTCADLPAPASSVLIEAEAAVLPATTAHKEEEQEEAAAKKKEEADQQEASNADAPASTPTPSVPGAMHAVQDEADEARQLLRRPMFYLYPSILGSASSAGNKKGTTHNNATISAPKDETSVVHRVFVRMAHTTMLNEESLNPYFGRYGQVSCTLQRRLRLSDLRSHDLTKEDEEEDADNNKNSSSSSSGGGNGDGGNSRHITRSHATSGGSSMAIMLLSELYQCLPQELWLQDFVIVVDSYENALRALERAHYKELLFIALHDPALNAFSLAELDTMLAECPTSTVAIRLAEARGVEAGGLRPSTDVLQQQHRRGGRGHRRQRKRARHEQQKQQQQQGTSDKRARKEEAEVSSSSSSNSSSATSSSDYDEDDEDNSASMRASQAASRIASPAAEGVEEGAAKGRDQQRDGALDFVPDLVLDGFPYWMTEDQLKAIFQEHGTVHALHLSIDDLSGAFTGAVMLRMSSVAEAIRVSEAMDKLDYKGCTLRCGVLTPELAVVDVRTGEVRVEGPALPEGFDVALNEQLYV